LGLVLQVFFWLGGGTLPVVHILRSIRWTCSLPTWAGSGEIEAFFFFFFFFICGARKNKGKKGKKGHLAAKDDKALEPHLIHFRGDTAGGLVALALCKVILNLEFSYHGI
jgi:hypothetical protein